MLLCAAVHIRVQPYAYKIQNTLETWLFVSDVMFVSLGIGYSFMDPNNPNRDVVEPLLVLLLLGTLVGAAAYLSWHHRRFLQHEMRTRAAPMMSRARTTTIATPEHSRKKDMSGAAVEMRTSTKLSSTLGLGGSVDSLLGTPPETPGSRNHVRIDQGERKSLVSAGI